MTFYNNPNILPLPIIHYRLMLLDNTAQIILYRKGQDDDGTIRYIVDIASELPEENITNLLSTGITPEEQNLLTAFQAAGNNFDNLPNWATWSAQQANDYVVSNILNGRDQVQIDTWIDTNVTTLATAKTALKLLATSIISIRTIMSFMAKAIIFIRDYIIKLRR